MTLEKLMADDKCDPTQKNDNLMNEYNKRKQQIKDMFGNRFVDICYKKQQSQCMPITHYNESLTLNQKNMEHYITIPYIAFENTANIRQFNQFLNNGFTINRFQRLNENENKNKNKSRGDEKDDEKQDKDKSIEDKQESKEDGKEENAIRASIQGKQGWFGFIWDSFFAKLMLILSVISCFFLKNIHSSKNRRK